MIEEIAMRAGLRRLVDLGAAKRADAGEAMADVEGVGDLALLAVTDAIDAARDLLFDNLAHRAGEPSFKRRFVEAVAGFARLEHPQQVGRTRQAADMSRQNMVGAELHRRPPLLRLVCDCARAHPPPQGGLAG